MSVNGVRFFRYALLFESFGNIASALTLLVNPRWSLGFIVDNHVQLTPATLTMGKFLGACILALTPPLILSYPNNPAGIALRRPTYWALGTGEVALAAVLAADLGGFSGDSGLSHRAQVVGFVTMISFLAMRYFFLFANPGYMEAQANSRKSK